MRVYNRDQLNLAVIKSLSKTSEPAKKYADWLVKSALPGLMKNMPEFVSTFLCPIKSVPMLVFEPAPGQEAPVSYFYHGLNNVKTRVYIENVYDKKDVDAGILHVFEEKRQLLPWLYANYPLLLETRDFFDDLMEQKPDTDLRKYTLDTLPKQIVDWRVEFAARRARELEEQAARARAAAEADADIDAFFASSWNSARTSLEKEQFSNVWQRMVEGKDYNLLGFYKDFSVVVLLSPRALDWEAGYKGSCIAGSGYKRRLQTRDTVFISFRPKDSQGESLVTAEYLYYAPSKTFSLVQQETWGYKRSSQSEQLATPAQLEDLSLNFPALLGGYDKKLLFNPVNNSSEFVIHRSI